MIARQSPRGSSPATKLAPLGSILWIRPPVARQRMLACVRGGQWTRQCCLHCPTRFHSTRTLPVLPPPLTVCRQTVAGQRTAPAIPASATAPFTAPFPGIFNALPGNGTVHVYMHERGRARGSCRHPTPQKRQALESRQRRSGRQKRCPPRIKALWPHHLATMERLPPPKPRRDQPSHGLQTNHCRAADATSVKLLGQRPTARDYLITHEPQPVSAGDKAWAGFGRWPR